uniref:Heat shock protein 70 n=1 Tax=Panagrolaimus davidi TaxID=227884 RepID=A0A914Q8V5_9BILA
MAVAAERLALQNHRPSRNVLGIDLGTTNTVVAIWQAGKQNPEVLTINKCYERIIPSYVWCKDDGTFVVGRDALRNLKQFPQDVCYDAKRMIGQNFTNLTQLQSDYWSFKIVNNNGRPAYELSNGKLIEPEEISVQVLKKAKAIADAYACANLEYAVITVPAYFDQNQKQATIDAAKRAGLTVLQLVTEPTAAAFAFNYDHKRFDDYNLFVFDLGGGTFDITIISIKDGRFNVEACGGNNFLSGRDFDNLLMKDLRRRLEEHGAKNLNDVKQKIRLRALAETTKVALTTCDKEIVNCSDFIANATDKDGMFEITRAEFEKLAFQLKGFLRDACLEAMKKANLTSDEFANVLLIGGSSRMPMVSQLLNELFPQSFDSNFYQRNFFNPDEAVAYGAAIRAAQLLNPNHRDYKTIENLLPIGIGIGLIENQYSLMIPGGTKYPTKKKTRYCTTENDQKSAYIAVFEGERMRASDNQEILSFVLPDLPPGLAGDVYVDVTFEIDQNKFLKVTGESSTSVAEHYYRKVRHTTKLTEQLLLELTLNAENDEQKKILINARVELLNNAEDIRKRYENEKNIPYHKKRLIVDNCDEVIEWLNDNPDEPLDEDIINLAKQIEKDVEELIDLRLMSIQPEKHYLNFMKQKEIFEDGKFHLRNDVETIRKIQGNELNVPYKQLTTNICDTVSEIGSRITPSYVYIGENDEIYVGKSAINYGRKKPERLIYEKIYTPEMILAELLKKLASYVDQKLEGVVLTVPAYFSSEQKNKILEAAEMAGIKVLQLICEPTAAAIEYGMEHSYINREMLFVFDMGGRTLDITVIKVLTSEDFEVVISDGDQQLSGRDFGGVIVEWILKELERQIGNVNDKLNSRKKYKMAEMAKEAKEALSQAEDAIIQLSEVYSDACDVTLTRSEFEELSKGLVAKVKECIESTLKCKALNQQEINHVLFVGGASKMPMIKNLLKEFFNESKFSKTVNAEEIVARGAARMASKIGREEKRTDIKLRFYEGMYDQREKNTHIGSMKFKNLTKENFKNDIKFTIDEDGTVEISHDKNTSVQYRTHLYDLQKPSFQNDEKVNAVGIDFGNTTCFAAIARNNDNEAITLGNTNERALLSYVSYDERHVKCGKGVVNRMLWHAKSTIYDIKKIIGKDIESIEIDDKWPFKIIKTDRNVSIEIESFNNLILKDPEEVMAVILKYVKEKLFEENDERNFKEIVLSIPANFNNKEKEAILKAAELAKLKNVILLPDPISAYTYEDVQKDCEVSILITRKKFEDLSKSLLSATQEALDNFKLWKIDKVLQVGGGCRMPMIKRLLQNEFPNAQHLCHNFPEEAIARGAAFYANNSIPRIKNISTKNNDV